MSFIKVHNVRDNSEILINTTNITYIEQFGSQVVFKLLHGKIAIRESWDEIKDIISQEYWVYPDEDTNE